MKGQTTVSIEGSAFLINGQLTYTGRSYQGVPLEGLLMNTRMVQGIFDDKNPDTVGRWAYPDTGMWDAERNTREFIAAMPDWRAHGVLAFTLNLQGGSPEGYSKLQPWYNSAFLPDGTLDSAYLVRLEQILDAADALGMVVILGYFYFGQDYRLESETAVKQAVANATTWLAQQGYRNVLIEIANECNIAYKHPLILAPRVHELIELTHVIGRAVRPEAPLLVGSSFSGGAIPTDNVVAVSDFLLIHGNGSNTLWVPQQIAMLKQRSAYRGQPIVNNEDDHFDFDKEANHLLMSVHAGVSWGYFDPGSSNYQDGYQCPPVNWGINSERKQAFFDKVKEMTGA